MRAFTLIELMITSMLLVLVVSVVVINVEVLIPSYRIEGAARELGATAADVRAQAMIAGKVHGIVYDLTGGRFWILAPPEEDEEEIRTTIEEEKGKDPDLQALEPFTLHKGVKFKDVSLGGERKRLNRRVKILFEPDGTGMPHSVHLEDRDGNEYTIEVNPFTGTVEFFEGYKEFDLFIDEED